MRIHGLALVLFLLSAPPGAARLLRVREAAHPISDCITLVQHLATQVEEEQKAETLAYEKFEYWCARSKKQLTEAIDAGAASLEELDGRIKSATEAIDVLNTEITALLDEISRLNNAQNAAQIARNAENALAQAEITQLLNTQEAVRDALTELTDAQENISTGLLQQHIEKVLALVGTAASQAQRSLLQTATPPPRPNLTAEGDYEAHVNQYSFKSNKVIDILAALLAKFKEDRVNRVKEETNAENAFQLATAARTDLINAATAAENTKDFERTALQTALSDDQTERNNVDSDLTADKGTLKSTTDSCHIKASEWAERSKIREHEKQALAAAVEVLEKATGVRHLPPQSVALPTPIVFLEIGNPEVQKALKLLRQEARTSKSKVVAQLAQAVALRPVGPFDQVINSIEKLVYRLHQEQTEEDNHKHWCDRELEKTSIAKDDLTTKKGDLDGKISVAAAKVVVLQNARTDAANMVKQLDEHMADATAIRKANKEENQLAIKDAEAAQAAIAQAVAVIRTFYKSTGKIAFVQADQSAPVTLPVNPPTWSQDYTGVADPTDPQSGIITVLQAVSGDFSTMESQTIAQEDSDQDAYELDIKNSKIEKARKTEEMQVADQAIKRSTEKQASWQATLNTVEREIEATEQYETDLQPACVNGSYTYEDRKHDRAEEIAALQAAQAHLQDAFENITEQNATTPWTR